MNSSNKKSALYYITTTLLENCVYFIWLNIYMCVLYMYVNMRSRAGTYILLQWIKLNNRKKYIVMVYV